MIWTDTQNMNGTVGWLKLTGKDDPIVTFFLSLKPDIININTRKKFTFRDIYTWATFNPVVLIWSFGICISGLQTM